MNVKKFFELAKERGITASQLVINRSKCSSIETFNHAIENYSIADNQSAVASGLFGGRYGSVRTDRIDQKTIPWLVDGIIKAAKANESGSGTDFFPGSPKYRKKNIYNKSIDSIALDDVLKNLYQLEEEARAKEPRITDFDASFEKVSSSSEFYNSHGLKLVNKKSSYYYVVALYARNGEELRNSYQFDFGIDPSKMNLAKMIDEAIKDVRSQFGGVPCESGKYPTVIKNDVFASLIDYVVSAASSEQVQKKSSFLAGKLGTKVGSSKLTVSERPLEKTPFFSYFDVEGVARYNKNIIKNGRLETYLYNRDTAKKDGVESTGNAEFSGGKIGIGYGTIFVKPSKKGFEEMIAPIKKGVYITSIQGLGTGMNSINGDFSCQASGFMIRNGKTCEPLTLITLSGSLLKMMEDIKDIDSNAVLGLDGISSPDVYVRSMSIGGK